MKKLFFYTTSVAFLLIAFNYAIGQKITKEQSTVYAKGIINFKELADKELLHPPKIGRLKDNEEKEENLKGIPVNKTVPADAKVFNIPANNITIPFVEQPPASSPPPIKSFDGLPDNNQVIPPDVNGAAGPNHLMETLNSQYRIFNKSGGTLSTLTLSSFWSGLSGVGSPYSDPHIVYDATAGRWLACIIGTLNNGHYSIFVAASLTNDPTGSWYEYSFDTGPSSTLPDYPLLGYNNQWIVITTNDFLNLFFSKVRILVMDKSAAISGTLGGGTTFFDASGAFTISPAETMDAGQNTEYMLSNYGGNIGAVGYVRVFSVTGSVGSPVYNVGSTIGVNQPWSETTLDAPQKGSTQLINTNGTKMRTVVVRNGYIWATHTIYLPYTAPTRSSVDFWQINASNNSVVQYGKIDDPTGKYRLAFPSLGVTSSNQVLLGACVFGSSLYASCAYGYRNSTDALNIFRTPYILKMGQASYYKTYGGSRNRWGDYTATCVDPSDGTFWTLLQYAKTPANTWATFWGNVAPAAEPASYRPIEQAPVSNATISINPNPAKGNFVLSYTTEKAGAAIITIYNAKGDAVHAQKVNAVAGVNRYIINIGNIVNGNYSVSIKNGDELKQMQLIIEK